MINQSGPKLLSAPNSDRILATLASYINDQSPEVRFNARNALLALEHGPNPVGTREEIERYVKKALKKEADQAKVLAIFSEGLDKQKSLEASLNNFNQLAKSSIRQSSQA